MTCSGPATRPEASFCCAGVALMPACLAVSLPTRYPDLPGHCDLDAYPCSRLCTDVLFLTTCVLAICASTGCSCLLQYVSEHAKHGAPGTANYIDARTKWFDEAVQSVSKQGISQVVIIAAGFDSRAYRFHAPCLQVKMHSLSS